MPTDTAPFDVTVRTAAPVPVIASGEEAIRAAEVILTIAAVDPAIAQVPRGHFLVVNVLTTLGTPEQRRRNARTHASHDPVAWKYHHVGNYLLNSVLPPDRGQI
jgi:hypothetical protein